MRPLPPAIRSKATEPPRHLLRFFMLMVTLLACFGAPLAANAAPSESKKQPPKQQGSSKANSAARPAATKRAAPTSERRPRAPAAGKSKKKAADKPGRPKSGAKKPVAVSKKPTKKRRLGNQYLEIPEAEQAFETPAYRYANMTDAQVLAELRRRNLPFRLEASPPATVRVAVRLTGPLHGVRIRSALPEAQWATTPFDIMDGRLMLALDDFCQVLARHDVVEIIHFTIYRPAPEAIDPSREATRHPAGLAIDVGALKKSTEHWLAVGPHWSSAIGSKTCGTGARAVTDPSGREIVSIVCEAADERIFHYMLTPHYNEEHSDHLHLEVKPGVKWFLYN